MTLIEKTLKSFDKHFPISIDYPPIAEMEVFTKMEIDARHKRAIFKHEQIKSFLTQALQEQDRESRRDTITDAIQIIADNVISMNIHDELGLNRALRNTMTDIKDYAKQHNIDLHEN